MTDLLGNCLCRADLRDLVRDRWFGTCFGVQDAHTLAWMLAAVLRGEVGEAVREAEAPADQELQRALTTILR